MSIGERNYLSAAIKKEDKKIYMNFYGLKKPKTVTDLYNRNFHSGRKAEKYMRGQGNGVLDPLIRDEIHCIVATDIVSNTQVLKLLIEGEVDALGVAANVPPTDMNDFVEIKSGKKILPNSKLLRENYNQIALLGIRRIVYGQIFQYHLVVNTHELADFRNIIQGQFQDWREHHGIEFLFRCLNFIIDNLENENDGEYKLVINVNLEQNRQITLYDMNSKFFC